MNSAICTLFEGDYHFGVAALANSLYANGFRGTVYAGYRGALPQWASEAMGVEGAKELAPAEGLVIRFIPLATESHFTNYKPDFMLQVWEDHAPNARALFYFDPDITTKCRWTFFEEWVEAGVALCADVNPTMATNHPIRHAWIQFLKQQGREVNHDLDTFFNGGFIGVSSEDRSFLALWKSLIVDIGRKVGGLEKMIVADRSECFYIPDQDALNISAMACETSISPMGQDGMDFQHGGGGYVMSHAVGKAKPWNKRFVRTVLTRASPPSRADKQFFKHVEFPIHLYSSQLLFMKRSMLSFASFIGRFMRNM